jgi:lambda family phage tail tape measure protein
LLGLELTKLKEQEKQIIINRDKKLLEAQVAKRILDDETERVRQQGYMQGLIKLSEDTQRRQLDTAKAMLDVQLKEIDYATELLNIEIEQNMALSDNAKALAKQTTDYQASIAKLQKQLDALPEYIQPLPDQELSAEAEANNRRIDAIKKQMEFETARHNLRMDQLNKERTFEYGFERAVNQILDNGTNAARIASDMVNSVFGNMESALENFVKTGKFSFSDFTRSVIRDLIAIQMKAQAVQMLRSVGGVGGLLGSISSGFNSVFGFKNEAGFTEVAGSLGFANGGDPPVGQASLVGERGPELFVPKTAGTVIPNHSLMGMLGNNSGQTINYNGPFIQNMSAIDTQSGIQFLSRNKQAVWAANQSAQRSLPVSK